MGRSRDHASRPDAPPPIGGYDDAGRTYGSLDDLWAVQTAERDAFYAANDAWWANGGYGGSTDDAAMIGDDESAADVADSCRFLDGLLVRHPRAGRRAALDAAAGVGRVTKHVLLRRYESVHLVEACEEWSKQSRRYLGNKRCQACTFTRARLESYSPRACSYDLVWLQWALQYLTDADAVSALRHLAAALRPSGLLVLKENRPYGGASERRFQLDTPEGEHGRYDITRPDVHHRHLFSMAHLDVVECERCEETNYWVLRPQPVGADGGSPHHTGRAMETEGAMKGLRAGGGARGGARAGGADASRRRGRALRGGDGAAGGRGATSMPREPRGDEDSGSSSIEAATVRASRLALS